MPKITLADGREIVAVYQKKPNGAVYVYESISYWDAQKKAPRTKQKYVGRLNTETNEIVYRREPSSIGSDELPTVKTIGPYLVLSKAAAATGLLPLLKSSFRDDWQQLLALAFYSCASGKPFYLCENWCDEHRYQGKEKPTSQSISKLLLKLDSKQVHAFLVKWCKKIAEGDMLCYDITSISSYSQAMDYVRYGYNRDKEKLPQINLALLFGQNSELPAFMRILPGSIVDVTTLCTTSLELRNAGARKLCFVMDKGFSSRENISSLYANKINFLIAVTQTFEWIENIIDMHWQDLNTTPHFVFEKDHGIYASTYLHNIEGHRCYVHLIYDDHIRTDKNDNFMKELVEYADRRRNGLPEEKRDKFFERFINVKTTPKRGTKIVFNEQEIDIYKSRYTGVTVLLSDKIKSVLPALKIYRRKDVVEKCFDDAKNAEDCKRLHVHSDKAAVGKLFICFLGLILRSYIAKAISTNKELEKLGIPKLFKELNTLKEIKEPHKYNSVHTEVTKWQREIFKAVGVDLR